MMRGAASLHADEAGGKLGKERQDLRPPQRFADDNVPFSIAAMHLKDALGQIDADGGDVHNRWLLYRVVAATAPLQGIRMTSTGAGAIHPICFRVEAKFASAADMGALLPGSSGPEAVRPGFLEADLEPSAGVGVI